MNSYKFNSQSQYYLRRAIAKALDIPLEDIYKTVKDVNVNSIDNTVRIITETKVYKLTLIEET